MIYKYVLTNSKNPYYNLAFEQLLCDAVDRETRILYLWQNENTIVIGRNQDVYAECKADEFLSKGGNIARRHSGGGAVWHDLGNLNYSIISQADNMMENIYQNIVFEVLSAFGITADFNGKNDLMIEGRKFSGNASFKRGTVMCQHGTILLDADIDRMTYYLTPDAEKLSRNRVKSVASRVVNLSELSSDINAESLSNALIETTKAVPLEYCLDKNELQNLASIFASDNWIYRRNFK